MISFHFLSLSSYVIWSKYSSGTMFLYVAFKLITCTFATLKASFELAFLILITHLNSRWILRLMAPLYDMDAIVYKAIVSLRNNFYSCMDCIKEFLYFFP